MAVEQDGITFTKNFDSVTISTYEYRNFKMVMGDAEGATITWCFYVKKSLINRIKYALFCLFFPFKIEMWSE